MKMSHKIEGLEKLRNNLDALPDKTLKKLDKDVRKTSAAIAAIARTLVPVASGQLKSWINYQIITKNNVTLGFVNFAPDNKDDIIKALSVEYGRKISRKGTGSRIKGSTPDTGTTEGAYYQQGAVNVHGPRFQRRMRTAIRKALKEFENG